jgi:hypothetical protein
LKRPMKKSQSGLLSSSRDLSSGPPKYEAGVLNAQPWYSVSLSNFNIFIYIVLPLKVLSFIRNGIVQGPKISKTGPNRYNFPTRLREFIQKLLNKWVSLRNNDCECRYLNDSNFNCFQTDGWWNE